MKYKIKQVSRILNIPVDTLRYYEKIGVITPKIDEKNRYRYYDAWDINYILEYVYYRKMDYSTNEIIRFIHKDSLDNQLQLIKEKQTYYEEKRNYYAKLAERNQWLTETLECIEEKINQISLEYCPEYHYIIYRDNYTFRQQEDINQEIGAWLKKYPFVEDIVIIPKKVIMTRDDNEYAWTFAVSKDYFETVGLKKGNSVATIKKSLCISTIVDAREQGMFHYELLDPLLRFAQEHNFKLAGDPFGLLLIRTHEGDRLHRYIKFYVPIEP